VGGHGDQIRALRVSGFEDFGGRVPLPEEGFDGDSAPAELVVRARERGNRNAVRAAFRQNVHEPDFKTLMEPRDIHDRREDSERRLFMDGNENPPDRS
jgi:hypothetical protein